MGYVMAYSNKEGRAVTHIYCTGLEKTKIKNQQRSVKNGTQKKSNNSN